MSLNCTCFFKEEVGLLTRSYVSVVSDMNAYSLKLNSYEFTIVFIYVKRVFPISNGLESRVNTMSWLLTFSGQALKTSLTIAIGSSL